MPGQIDGNERQRYAAANGQYQRTDQQGVNQRWESLHIRPVYAYSDKTSMDNIAYFGRLGRGGVKKEVTSVTSWRGITCPY
ncbi:hypothetical protein SLIQ_03890 [Serratia liquefaciens FK01]|nr:hypothetical protein SLIQ_03890 [Serratia liquefaciens FK01]